MRPATLARYQSIVRRFVDWYAAFGCRDVEVEDVAGLDSALLLYAHSGHVKRSEFGQLLSAIQFFLPQIDRLPFAAQARRGWQIVCRTVHKTPLLWVFALAVAQAACAHGEARIAAGFLIQFGGYLRPGELLALTRADVVLPEASPPFAGAPACTLLLGDAARGTKVNRRQVAHITEPACVDALRYLVATASASKLLPCTHSQYSRVLARAVAHIGLESAGLHFTPHSFRAGAATQARLDGTDLNEIKRRGRWASDVTLRMYLDETMAIAARTLDAARPYLPLLANPYGAGPIFCCL